MPKDSMGNLLKGIFLVGIILIIVGTFFVTIITTALNSNSPSVNETITETYIYIGGIYDKVYQYWESNMTKKDETASFTDTVNSLIIDDTYIYAVVQDEKIHQFWQSNMTEKAETLAYGGLLYPIAQDDEYVYSGGTVINKAYQYWKSNMTKKAESPECGDTGNGAFINVIAVDDTYLYAGGYGDYDYTPGFEHWNGTVFQFWKSNMTQKAKTEPLDGFLGSINVDDSYLYMGAGQDWVGINQYWKNNLTLKDEQIYPDLFFGMINDSTYLYAGGYGDTKAEVLQCWKTNMSIKTKGEYDFSTTGAWNIWCLAQDSTYVYAGGDNNTVEQFYKNNLTKKSVLTYENQVFGVGINDETITITIQGSGFPIFLILPVLFVIIIGACIIYLLNLAIGKKRE